MEQCVEHITNGRYNNDKFSLAGAGEWIKGNDFQSKESYNDKKNTYNNNKQRYSNGEINGNPQGGYKNWTPKAVSQDYVDDSAVQAMDYKPGLGGKITRAASVPLIGAANLAGRIAKRFGGKSVSESQMYDELIEMISEANLNSNFDRIVSESIDRVLRNGR